jgi:hypothetical protein
MPIQQFDEGPGTGALLGESLGQGLQNLAEMKLGEWQRRNEQAKLSQALDKFFPGRGSQLASLPQPLQQLLMKEEMRAPGRAAFANALNAIMSGKEMPPESAGDLTTEELNKLAALQLQKTSGEETRRIREATEQTRKETALTQTQQREQSRIDRTNKPFVDYIDRGAPLAKSALDLSGEILDLMKTGKTVSGVRGLLPTVFQPAEAQQMKAKISDLITLLAASSETGKNASKYKLQLTEAGKVALEHRPETQFALLKGIQDKSGQIVLKGLIKNALIDANDGRQPENISAKTDKFFNKIERARKKMAIGDDLIEDELGIRLRNMGTYWEPVGFEEEEGAV